MYSDNNLNNNSLNQNNFNTVQSDNSSLQNNDNNSMKPEKKKNIGLFIAIGGIVCVVGVGAVLGSKLLGNKNNDLNQDSNILENNGDSSENENTPNSSNEITLENLMKAPESPESDFDVVDHGNGDVELLRYKGSSEIVVIPETWNGKKITTISSYVFGTGSNVKAIRIADSVKNVMEFAFAMNTNLEIAVCGSGVVELGNSAFQGCTSLRELVLNDGLVKLGHISIGGCTNLKFVSVPETVTDISHMAFYGCPEDFVIGGKAGSVIEQYAISKDIIFKASK